MSSLSDSFDSTSSSEWPFLVQLLCSHPGDEEKYQDKVGGEVFMASEANASTTKSLQRSVSSVNIPSNVREVWELGNRSSHHLRLDDLFDSAGDALDYLITHRIGLRCLDLQGFPNLKLGEKQMRALRRVCTELAVLKLGGGWKEYGTVISDEAAREIAQFKRVKELRLDTCIISEYGIELLAQMEWLEKLSLNEFLLAKVAFDRITRMKGLRELEIMNYELGSHDSLSNISRLTTLKKLTNLGGVPYGFCPNIARLSGLQELHLEGEPPRCLKHTSNQLYRITDPRDNDELEPISTMHRLQKLTLDHLPIGTRTAEGISRMRGLKELSLGRWCVISVSGLEYIGGKRGLTHFSCSSCEISDRAVRALADNNTLRALRIYGCAQSEWGAEQIKGLTKLETLNFIPHEGCRVEDTRRDVEQVEAIGYQFIGGRVHDASAELVATSEKLKELVIGFCSFSNRAMKHISGIQSLSKLTFIGCTITEKNASQFTGMQQLQQLVIQSCIISEQSKKSLRQSLGKQRCIVTT